MGHGGDAGERRPRRRSFGELANGVAKSATKPRSPRAQNIRLRENLAPRRVGRDVQTQASRVRLIA
jgi:hypothetical protein